jgi:hypothetical protein
LQTLGKRTGAPIEIESHLPDYRSGRIARSGISTAMPSTMG